MLLALPLAGAGVAAGDAWLTTPDRAAIVHAASALPPGPSAEAAQSLAGTPRHLVDALLATEDRRFYAHPGIDARRLLGAAWSTLKGRRQGGSTITQQLARNLFPEAVGRERSLTRKLRELAVALRIEQAFEKDEILSLYLRAVSFRHSVRGVAAASESYFGKPLAALEPAESALIVALLKGPSQYDPDRWPRRAAERRDLVIRLTADWTAASMRSADRSAHPAATRVAGTGERLDGARSPAHSLPRESAAVTVPSAHAVSVAARP